MNGALVAILWRSSHLLQLGQLTIGDFVLFWFFLDRFAAPIRDIAERYNVLQSAMAAAERIFLILDAPENIRSRANAIRPESLAGTVEFDKVSFAYNDGDRVYP